MADTEDMQNERLLDYAYGELTAGDAAAFERELEGSPELKAELDALERTRAAARAALPDVEPPPAIANMLLHEAAKQANGVQSDEPGLWDRLLGWFQPLIAHPGLSAAAALVLFVAVVGTVGLSRVSEEAARGPSVAAEASGAPARPQATAATDDQADGARETGYAEEALAEAEPEADKEGKADKVEDLATAGDSVSNGLLGSSRDMGETAGKAEDRRTAELADAKQENRLRRERAQRKRAAPEAKKKARSRRKRSSRGASSDPLAPLEQDSKSADGFGGVGKAAPAPADSDSDDAAVFADEAPPARSKSAPPATKAPARPAPRPSRNRAPQPTSPPPSAAVPAGGGAFDDAEAEAAAPPRGPQNRQRVRSEKTLAQLRAVARTLKDSSQRCREVARLANDIRDRDPSFYKKNVATDAAVRSCNRAVVAETTRRARRRRAKRSDSKATAAEPAGEAAEAADQD